MALFGDLSEISLADLLYLVTVRHLSGRLALQSGHDDAVLWFVEGNLVHVAASAAIHHLGQGLVRRGRLTLSRLGEALAHQANTSSRPPLGRILVERGWLTSEELETALTDQAEDILYGILAWPYATFSFVAVDSPPPGLPLRELNMERIILEATRRADEHDAIRRRIPNLECVVSLVNESLMTEVDADDRAGRQAHLIAAALTHIKSCQPPDGSSNGTWVTLNQIVRITRLEEGVVLRTVYDLLHRGVLVIDVPQAAGLAPVG